MREHILGIIEDLCADFLYYDRKNDEELGIGAIEEAVVNGIITIDEMVAEFKKHLIDNMDT